MLESHLCPFLFLNLIRWISCRSWSHGAKIPRIFSLGLREVQRESSCQQRSYRPSCCCTLNISGNTFIQQNSCCFPSIFQISPEHPFWPFKSRNIPKKKNGILEYLVQINTSYQINTLQSHQTLILFFFFFEVINHQYHFLYILCVSKKNGIGFYEMYISIRAEIWIYRSINFHVMIPPSLLKLFLLQILYPNITHFFGKFFPPLFNLKIFKPTE